MLWNGCPECSGMGVRNAPEYAMKVLAMKNDPSRALQEMADIQHLLELPKIDEAEVRGYFERHGLIEAFHEIKRRSRSA